MLFSKAYLDDHDRRMGIRQAAPVPCTARSLTEGEARSSEIRRAGVATTIVLGMAILWAGYALTATPVSEVLIPTGGGLALIAVMVALITGFRLRKRYGYRDPRATVEIGAEEVVVTGPAARDSRAYAALAPIELLSGSSEGSRYFIGIVLDTKLGPIRLEDDQYHQGKAAAGAILKRMDELGLPLTA